MEIVNTERTAIKAEQNIDTIINALKNVRIVSEPEVRPYGRATITLEEIQLSEIQPIAKYILQKALAKQFAIRTDLLQLGRDSLHLDNALHITHDNTPAVLIPPIVEETNEGLCLVDGLHRSMVARSIGHEAIKVLRIANVDSDYPLTSYPNRWDEIRMYDAVPTDRSLKKNYRSNSHFFRDLSQINGSFRRGAGVTA